MIEAHQGNRAPFALWCAKIILNEHHGSTPQGVREVGKDFKRSGQNDISVHCVYPIPTSTPACAFLRASLYRHWLSTAGVLNQSGEDSLRGPRAMVLNLGCIRISWSVLEKILMPRSHSGLFQSESMCVRPRPQNFIRAPSWFKCAARMGCIHRFRGCNPPEMAAKLLYAWEYVCFWGEGS